MGTAERRIEIMRLLCRKRHATMPELAETFGVSIRTIQRDILEIELMGVPLEVKTGRYDGGVYIAGDYAMDRMYMRADELSLLHKIKSIGTQGGQLALDTEEKAVLDALIRKYTKPSV